MAAEVDKPVPPTKSRKGLFLFVLVGMVAVGGGAAVPWFMLKDTPATKKEVVEKDRKPELVPFGDVVVNLGGDTDGRLTRYLRVKIVLVTEDITEKAMTEVMAKQKAFLKNWLISYLSDQSPQDVSRAAGVNRVRREIRDQFNAMLFPDGSEKIQDILFDEFVVQ